MNISKQFRSSQHPGPRRRRATGVSAFALAVSTLVFGVDAGSAVVPVAPVAPLAPDGRGVAPGRGRIEGVAEGGSSGCTVVCSHSANS